MPKHLLIGIKAGLVAILSLAIFNGNIFAQKITFGDLIPGIYLPSSIRPSDHLDCGLYFHLADSINQHVFGLTGMNPVPWYHCGNDSLSYSRGSIDTYVNELSPGSILARMIIDRNGSPVCCKVYMRGSDKPDKQIADALSKLVMLPCYRNGEPIPTECRFLYDFLTSKTYGGKKSLVD